MINDNIIIIIIIIIKKTNNNIWKIKLISKNKNIRDGKNNNSNIKLRKWNHNTQKKFINTALNG